MAGLDLMARSPMLATLWTRLHRRQEAAPPCLAPDLEEIRAARRTTAHYIMTRMKEAVICSDREEVLDIALQQMPAEGLVCEFGVFEGQTISHIARQMPERQVFGFNSFEGLPEDWRGPFQRGVFSLSGRLPVVPSNVTLIKGWFDATLPGFAARHPEPAALLHVDCDLYSSTKCIFANLGRRIVPGSVIVFDEYFDYPGWQDHEHLAFSEFVASYNLSYRYLAYNRLHEQVAVQIVNVGG